MALRLAGEEFSVVRGLDALGWAREIEANDADPGLKVTQSGSGPGVKVVSGDVDLNSNLLKNAKLGSTLNANGQDIASLGKLKFTDILLKEDAYDMLGVRNAADSAYRGLAIGDVGMFVYSGRIEFIIDAQYIAAPGTDNFYTAFRAQDNGVGVVEVARLQGAADPYFSMGGSQQFKFFNSGVATLGGDTTLGANKLIGVTAYLKQDATDKWSIRKVSGNDFADLEAQGIQANGVLKLWGQSLEAYDADGGMAVFKARDTGVGMAEVARLQGAADPYFQATLPMRLNPSSVPGTPMEGHFWYDATAKKLKFYNGTGVETVTSA